MKAMPSATISARGATRTSFMISFLSRRLSGLYRLLLESQGEADELRIVFAVLGQRNGEVNRNGHLPEEGQSQTNARPDAGADCTEANVRLNCADVGEYDAAQRFGIEREADLGRARPAKVAADSIIFRPGSWAHAAESK